ncbi:M23 family metallopeptidase [Paludibaculum fermentans]|uniref:M23 family metallopeptidase n=1 Tax=Paludibaculum fermentans TaxID=1473598 RepID=A0A7S7NWT3_PALFE|nr:M23 family metallopeptidase [Paludibaculum fermentans]QOY91212.1 M23 family metallopeptidase [Paludibaculum fermentans]
MRIVLFALLLPLAAEAATVGGLRLGSAASESSCAITRPAVRFTADSEQAFVQFVARGVRAGDRLRIEWVTPGGAVSSSVPYDTLPTTANLCFLSALPIGGFEPATQPGNWTVRVVLNDAVVQQSRFEVQGSATNLAARVVQVTDKELVIDATGATSDTSINIARYSPSGGWQYIAPLLAEHQEGNRITAPIPKLEAAEYLVILRNPDGSQSPPSRFVVSTGGGYAMPILANEHWRISQRPYGSYSHWGRSIHAYDIAPIDARFVTAMRGGIVSAHDLGFGQTPNLRIFGNYITIQHDDGEFSHYAHLKTGTFRVRSGQRVDAGEVLAEVGTSGYSFGRHVHVHVTKSASISSQSIPFRFEEKSAVLTKAITPGRPQVAKAPPARPRWSGEVGFSEWWTRILAVPRGAKALEVKLGWEDRGADFDLYVVSPSGQTYRPESEAVRIETPEPGPWRVSVQAVRGAGNSLSFWVEPSTR